MNARSRPQRSRAKGTDRDNTGQRLLIANEAARIIAEEGIRDYSIAKHKAAERLNVSQKGGLPSNLEIESALSEHLKLFHADTTKDCRLRLRRHALSVMELLTDFKPRLVGSVLSGQVTSFSAIQVHVTADNTENIGFLLDSHHIPYRITARRVRFGRELTEEMPLYSFIADDVHIEIFVFPPRYAHQAPLSPIDNRPMQRASAVEVKKLVSEDSKASN